MLKIWNFRFITSLYSAQYFNFNSKNNLFEFPTTTTEPFAYIFSTGKSDKTPVRPVRRHSFNSCKSNATTTTTGATTTTTESGDSHYEADVESGSSYRLSKETVAHINDANSSYSDSETGGKPLPGRIKSLWGSFKKKRMEVIHPRARASNNSMYGCFGEPANKQFLSVDNEQTSLTIQTVEQPQESSSSTSYHTPGSPVKHQSESSSSLSR